MDKKTASFFDHALTPPKTGDSLKTLSTRLASFIKYCNQLDTIHDNQDLYLRIMAELDSKEWNTYFSSLKPAQVDSQSYATLSQFGFVLTHTPEHTYTSLKDIIPELLAQEKATTSTLQTENEVSIKTALARILRIDPATIKWDTHYEYLWPLDIAIPDQKICVEIDGKHHTENPFQFANDSIRDQLLEESGWTIIRIKNSELVKAIEEGTLEALCRTKYELAIAQTKKTVG